MYYTYFRAAGDEGGGMGAGGEFLSLKRCVNVWLRLCASRKVTDPLRHEEESANRTSLGERVGGVGSYVSGARPEAGAAGYDRHCLLMIMSLPCTGLPEFTSFKFPQISLSESSLHSISIDVNGRHHAGGVEQDFQREGRCPHQGEMCKQGGP